MDAKYIAEFCAHKCLDKKAENVVILDLEGLSSVADYFVICSGYSDRQVSAIAEHIGKEMKELGNKANHEEGVRDGRWALMDFGSVIVHVFQDQLRDFYNLEGLWHQAKRIRISDNHDSGSNDSGSSVQGSEPDYTNMYSPGSFSF